MKFPWSKPREEQPKKTASGSATSTEAASATPVQETYSSSPPASESQQVSSDIIDHEKRADEQNPAPAPAAQRHIESGDTVTISNGNDNAAGNGDTNAFNQHGGSTKSEKNEATHHDLTRTVSTATESTDAGEPGEDDESKYATGLPLYLLTFGLTLSTFVMALDNTIIATAIPKITTVFNSLDDVGWYGSAYLLTTTSLQPSFGKVYTYFNVKWTYMLALVIFELGSVLCGAAVNSAMLIVGRAVAGAGAAALFSGGMTIIAYSVPLRKRPIYIGLLSSMFGIASVVGPILGGAFTDRVSWRWCFYINLPIGAIAITAVFFFFHNPKRKHSNLTTKQKIGQIDLVGAFFLICAIVCLLLALQWGGTTYKWSNSNVWGCLLGFFLLILVFTAIQIRKGELATLPPRILLHQRTVFVSAFFSAFLSMGIYTHIYYLPFYFQAVKGTTAEGSGIRTIPYLVSVTISSIVVGGSITMLGPYVPFTWIGSAIFAVGCGLLYTLKVNSSAATWIGYQILAGVGAGACVQIPFIAVQVVLRKKDIPVGNAVTIFFNSLGGAISISIAQNIFSNSLVEQIPKYTTGVDPRVIMGAGATHIREVTPPDQLPGLLRAYDIAVTNSYLLSIACACIAFLLSLGFEWRSVKGKKIEMGGAA
ncbi:MFS-type efflux pump MFS1 [Exophiala dermatitidis]